MRGLYLAVSTLALHFIVIFLGAEYETKRGFSTGIVVESPIGSARTWYFVLLGAAATLLLAFNLLRSRTGRAWRAIHGREAVAEALGISVARAKLSAFVVSSMLTAVAGCLFAYYRGFVSRRLFALSDDPVRRDDHHRRHGLLLGAVLGTVFVVLFPMRSTAAWRAGPLRAPFVGGICGQLHGVRRGDDSFPRIRAAGPGRNLASGAELVPALALQAKAALLMLKVENLEVTYHRVSTAVQGVSLEVAEGGMVALIGNNGAGKTTTLRAISGSSASTMRG